MGVREMVSAREARRRRIFKTLVAEQDHLALAAGRMSADLVRLSHRTIADTFCLPSDELGRIESEGIRRNWLEWVDKK
jgi:hypothetical protein